MEEKVKFNLGNFIIEECSDSLMYYRICTVTPQIEWKIYGESFIYNLIEKYLQDKDDETKEMLHMQIVAMYYMSTASDANLSTILFTYIEKLSDSIEVGDDIEISQAKASYYVKKMMTEQFNDINYEI